LIAILPVTGLIGFAIGFTVPTWLREAPRHAASP
jgi:hypothetical protein